MASLNYSLFTHPADIHLLLNLYLLRINFTASSKSSLKPSSSSIVITLYRTNIAISQIASDLFISSNTPGCFLSFLTLFSTFHCDKLFFFHIQYITIYNFLQSFTILIYLQSHTLLMQNSIMCKRL